MSDKKEPRTVPELSQAYSQLCAKAGDLQYKIHCLKKDLDMVNTELRETNLEAAVVIGKENKAKEEAAAIVTEGSSNG